MPRSFSFFYLSKHKQQNEIFSNRNFVYCKNYSTQNYWNLFFHENESTQKILILAAAKISPREN